MNTWIWRKWVRVSKERTFAFLHINAMILYYAIVKFVKPECSILLSVHFSLTIKGISILIIQKMSSRVFKKVCSSIIGSGPRANGAYGKRSSTQSLI